MKNDKIMLMDKLGDDPNCANTAVVLSCQVHLVAKMKKGGPWHVVGGQGLR